MPQNKKKTDNFNIPKGVLYSEVQCTVFVYHKVAAGDGGAQDWVALPRDELETLSNLLLRVSRDGADFLEGARNFLLTTGNVEARRGNSIVGSSFEMLLLVNLLEQSIAAILWRGGGGREEGRKGERGVWDWKKREKAGEKESERSVKVSYSTKDCFRRRKTFPSYLVGNVKFQEEKVPFVLKRTCSNRTLQTDRINLKNGKVFPSSIVPHHKVLIII